MNLEELEARITGLEDIEAIKKLQRIYAYYLDSDDMRDEIIDLFSDNMESIEIADHGVYLGDLNNIVLSIKDKSKGILSYCLYQNFPNPFNPTTKIKYKIPEFSNVKLTVYDVLGKEIKILVNEEKPAGNYAVEFNGTGLPSGVYFYRIETAKYSDTKKFVLLK